MSSCSNGKQAEKLDSLKTEIRSDGTATGVEFYKKDDDTSFWLDYVKYEIVGSYLSIVGCDKNDISAEPKLYAEVSIDGVTLKTRKIGDGAFKFSKISKIVIPNTVTSLGSECMYSCENLSSVTFPEGLTTIGSGAFKNCTSLTSITLPEGLTTIGGGAFSGCTSLNSITLPESLVKLGDSAFSGCQSLQSIIIPKNVTEIGYNCFQGCDRMKSIVFTGDTVPCLLNNRCYAWITAYVPQKAIVAYIYAYEVADGYSYFKEVLPYKEELPKE